MCLEFSKIDNEILNFFIKTILKIIPIIGKYIVGSAEPYDYLLKVLIIFIIKKNYLI